MRELLEKNGHLIQPEWFKPTEMDALTNQPRLAKHRLSSELNICGCRVNEPVELKTKPDFPADQGQFAFLVDRHTGTLYAWKTGFDRPEIPDGTVAYYITVS